jgi:hypothetical protein
MGKASKTKTRAKVEVDLEDAYTVSGSTLSLYSRLGSVGDSIFDLMVTKTFLLTRIVYTFLAHHPLLIDDSFTLPALLVFVTFLALLGLGLTGHSVLLYYIRDVNFLLLCYLTVSLWLLHRQLHSTSTLLFILPSVISRPPTAVEYSQQ